MKEPRPQSAPGTSAGELAPFPVRVGISSCLLGAEVRYDGGHKRDGYLVGELGRHVEWVPVCPELEAGMGVPREPVRLVRLSRDAFDVHLVGVKSGADWTDAMEVLARRRVAELARLELSGYVLKAKSPSCGLERVKVYGPDGVARKEGQGLFAAELERQLPWLPLEEEGRLSDAGLRESFIVRVFCHHRWLGFRRERFGVARLGEFHRRHKYLLLACSEPHLRKLGRLVAGARGRPAEEVCGEYAELFFAALRQRPTTRTHVNVLEHICGFFKEKLDAGDKRELREAIQGYRRGLLPRLVPLTLILHHLRRLGIPYVADQYYLSPHPRELELQYHA